MEVDGIQTQASKFTRVANGKAGSSKIGNRTTADTHHHQLQHQDEVGNDRDLRRGLTTGGTGILAMGDVSGGGGGNRLRSWQHSSRIIRVSRASGGKDRHSKVWTAKGPRDRRVRLSVATAIQFYDLQDRLGFDQPSKAVEWLIKAASDAISELPSLNSSFPETPRQLSDEKRTDFGGNVEQGFDSSAELEIDGDPSFSQGQQQQHGSNLSKSSACSSNSETSKGSGALSLSRNEIRVKARERARERTAKDKERDTESDPSATHRQQGDVNHHQLSQSSSFTQLLTAGIGNIENAGVSSSPMDYFNAAGLIGASSSARGSGGHHSSSGFSGQIIQLGNSGVPQAMMTVSPFGVGVDQHHHNAELQHFPFIADHHLVVQAPNAAAGATGSSNDHYNLNFSISPSSSGLAGYNNRGTLQSNSSTSLFPHLQRFSSSPLDGSALPFFLGTAVENQHHQHHNHHHSAGQFPPGFHLCYGDNGGRQSDQKGKGKN